MDVKRNKQGRLGVEGIEGDSLVDYKWKRGGRQSELFSEVKEFDDCEDANRHWEERNEPQPAAAGPNLMRQNAVWSTAERHSTE